MSKAQLWIALIGIGISGCTGMTTAQQVQHNPHRSWFNQTVQIHGTVIDRAPMIDAVVYQLQDETGEIWVLSSQPNIEMGDRVQVRGTVRFKEIAIEDLELAEAYIEELERQVKGREELDEN